MSPAAKTVLMTANYSHDIATAFLAVSGIVMAVLSRPSFVPEGPEGARTFVAAGDLIRKLAFGSLLYVLAAGVPRIIYYREFEWSSLAGDLQVVAILIKHVVMFVLVGAGILSWAAMKKKIRDLKVHYTLE